jgi:hypothetical protein
LVPVEEKECENAEQPIDTDNQPTIEKPPVDDEQVVGNVSHVSKPVNKKENEIQVLDYESGNLVPAKKNECDNVENPVNGEPPIGPCTVDGGTPIGPVVPHASEQVT